MNQASAWGVEIRGRAPSLGVGATGARHTETEDILRDVHRSSSVTNRTSLHVPMNSAFETSPGYEGVSQATHFRDKPPFPKYAGPAERAPLSPGSPLMVMSNMPTESPVVVMSTTPLVPKSDHQSFKTKTRIVFRQGCDWVVGIFTYRPSVKTVQWTIYACMGVTIFSIIASATVLSNSIPNPSFKDRIVEYVWLGSSIAIFALLLMCNNHRAARIEEFGRGRGRQRVDSVFIELGDLDQPITRPEPARTMDPRKADHVFRCSDGWPLATAPSAAPRESIRPNIPAHETNFTRVRDVERVTASPRWNRAALGGLCKRESVGEDPADAKPNVDGSNLNKPEKKTYDTCVDSVLEDSIVRNEKLSPVSINYREGHDVSNAKQSPSDVVRDNDRLPPRDSWCVELPHGSMGGQAAGQGFRGILPYLTTTLPHTDKLTTAGFYNDYYNDHNSSNTSGRDCRELTPIVERSSEATSSPREMP